MEININDCGEAELADCGGVTVLEEELNCGVVLDAGEAGGRIFRVVALLLLFRLLEIGVEGKVVHLLLLLLLLLFQIAAMSMSRTMTLLFHIDHTAALFSTVRHRNIRQSFRIAMIFHIGHQIQRLALHVRSRRGQD